MQTLETSSGRWSVLPSREVSDMYGVGVPVVPSHILDLFLREPDNYVTGQVLTVELE